VSRVRAWKKGIIKNARLPTFFFIQPNRFARGLDGKRARGKGEERQGRRNGYERADEKKSLVIVE